MQAAYGELYHRSIYLSDEVSILDYHHKIGVVVLMSEARRVNRVHCDEYDTSRHDAKR